ncbi:site-2 protease family protein [Companilactobacillus metriopterae]|uniref:site-2 protease family protein n=1 Tax=Companilactobacillus metriopterae TaxID=1909267 RepID=UPI00100AFEAC|nr:site-2 protease family protein [Companilactobacillus metriopterae]
MKLWFKIILILWALTILYILIVNNLVQNIFIYLFAFVIAICIHEFGHLIIGLFYKFKLEYIRLPLAKIGLSDKGNYSLSLEINVFNWFGSTKMIPNSYNVIKYAIFIVSGPVFSLLFGFLFLFISIPIIFSLFSLSIGLFTLIPLKYRNLGYGNDGYKFLKLISGDELFYMYIQVGDLFFKKIDENTFNFIPIIFKNAIYLNYNKKYIPTFLSYLNYYCILNLESPCDNSIKDIFDNLDYQADDIYLTNEYINHRFIYNEEIDEPDFISDMMRKLDPYAKKKLSAIFSKSSESIQEYRDFLSKSKLVPQDSLFITAENAYMDLLEKRI